MAKSAVPAPTRVPFVGRDDAGRALGFGLGPWHAGYADQGDRTRRPQEGQPQDFAKSRGTGAGAIGTTGLELSQRVVRGDGPSAARAQATQAAAARVATAVKHQLLGMSEDEERTAGACLPAASPDARLHHPRLMSSVCERA